MCIRDRHQGLQLYVTSRMKKNRIIKKKLIKTREEVEMMKNGLIDVFNLPITDQSKLIKYKDCRRTLREVIKEIHNQPVDENFRNNILKWEIQEIERTHNRIMCHKLHRFLKHRIPPALEMQNKNLIMTLAKELPLTPPINKLPLKVNDVDTVSYTHLDVYKRQL